MDQESAVPPSDRTRILIADDDRLFAQMLRRRLAMHDAFDVVGIADNGAEAIAQAKRLKPALVLMDVTMPMLDGIDATKEIRKLPDAPRVVLITGEDSESGENLAYEAGAAAYLRKSQELVSVIDAIVAVSRLSAAPS
jgi:DNA-binding NarL/FixJ family response regulator